MHTSLTWSENGPARGRLRQLLAVVATATAFGLLAALPTAPAHASSKPSITALAPVDVETLLAETPLSTLNTEQLAGVLAELPGFGEVNPAALQEALTKVIATLTGKGDTLGNVLEPGDVVPTLTADLKEVLGISLGPLEGLLGGTPTGKLTEALGSIGGTELLGELLASSSEPEKLLGVILGALNPEKLEGLLGSSLGAGLFSKSTVAGLASELETTPQTLVTSLGKTLTELPETATALTAPLSSGLDLSVLDGIKGLVFGLVGPGTESITEGTGGGGGTGGAGSSGGAGGSSSPGSTTVIVQGPQQTPTTSTAKATTVARKVKILSHRTHGGEVTVVVEVPSAGNLTLAGKGVRSMHRQSAKAERITLKAALTKAGTASLRKDHRHHHQNLKVTLRVSFKQTGGPTSTATVPVAFR